MKPTLQPPDFGINLVASIRSSTGQGVTARNIAKALQRHAVPFVIVDISYAVGDKLPIGDLEAKVAEYAQELRHPVNLYVLPLGIFGSIFESCPWLLSPVRLHVASFWWEVSVLPPAWIDTLSRLDAVIAATGFLANVAANGLILTPVIEANHPLELPEVIADRQRFGLPAEATLFAASFDPGSDPARKNPLATIEAFRMAFPAGIDNVHLAIRMNNAASEVGRATMEGMSEAAGKDARISFLIEPMTYEEVLSFFASCDAYVSLHRGEGLGLGLMESMALGKPVIATAWSGNMSFMDYGCGCPVRFRKTAVSGNWDFLKPDFVGPEAFWANPMIDDAAHWMRRLYDDPELRLRLGEAAKARIAAYQDRAWSRQWIDELIALRQAQAFLPRVPGKFSTAAP